MAITTPVLAGAGLMQLAMSGPYSFNNDEGDATPAVECVAAPGAAYNSAILVYVEGFAAQKPI